ncbi:MAG: DAK2 domain-containing protein [Lachnospiraceae bacterium]|nr:DAK2 domain-containing protein [Lachnospiraceae bacterium]MCI9470148.1 DAK2 domain-containing protein [Lachnospiraceae bacterium]
MSTNTIDARMLGKMFLAGARNLETKKEWINELNVFPVPDGDTGTNMTLTIMSAAAEVGKIENPTMETLAKAISSGSLRGARGNSGVILSQLLRGFTKVISEKEELDAAVLAAAMEKGVETAYKAVMKPKDGTILTVAKEAAAKASELSETAEDLQPFLEEILSCAEDVLERTPDMLPVLKEAGVVDSGGQGYVEVLRGALDAFLGKEVADTVKIPEVSVSPLRVSTPAQEEEIRFGYCTEFIVLLEDPMSTETVQGFKDYLSSIGDSLVVVADEELVKVHVHTNDPGLALQKGLSYGQLSRMKIDNMREEHQEKLFREAEKAAQLQAQEETGEKEQIELKDVGFISVSAGAGMKKIFQELGVDYLIEGGQTMNPSTEDMLNAIDQVPARTIYILPNNKNIILAANQAQALTKDKKIIVIPTTTIPQGITAILDYVPEKDDEENTQSMIEQMGYVKTGMITYAVRDTKIDHKEIHQDDIIGLGDEGLLAVGQDIEQAALDSVAALVDEDSELISIYYGEQVNAEKAEELLAAIEERYPDCDVELNDGGQPIYYYVLSVE